MSKQNKDVQAQAQEATQDTEFASEYSSAYSTDANDTEFANEVGAESTLTADTTAVAGNQFSVDNSYAKQMQDSEFANENSVGVVSTDAGLDRTSVADQVDKAENA